MAEDAAANAPPSRASSPSPIVSPSIALNACPKLERSLSAGSSLSSSSVVSGTGQSQDGTSGRRRGYMRPQATVFADSARNRDSVMSLGTIAHLQYYFARTGLLDGKGAQLAREKKGEQDLDSPLMSPRVDSWPQTDSSYYTESSIFSQSQVDFNDSFSKDDSSVMDSASHSNAEAFGDDAHIINLPPTVSTYKQRPTYIPPPPSIEVLRRELKESIEDAKRTLKELRSDALDSDPRDTRRRRSSASAIAAATASPGWHEIEGLHVLDLVTLAIRAAKNYYTAHEQPQRLYSIKSERRIRADLYAVLETLKKVATRDFAGGYRRDEIARLLEWLTSVEELMNKDEAAEREEHELRESWPWLEGEWVGREREREWLFLRSFDSDAQPLPRWPEMSESLVLPTAFLKELQDGRQLVRLHNALVKSSKRRFGEITSYHTDVAKPYRCMENLRYWVKAAQIRWDISLNVDVEGVVHGDNLAAWQNFDDNIFRFCRKVREELTNEWREQRQASQTEPPVVQLEAVGPTVSTEPIRGTA